MADRERIPQVNDPAAGALFLAGWAVAAHSWVAQLTAALRRG